MNFKSVPFKWTKQSGNGSTGVGGGPPTSARRRFSQSGEVHVPWKQKATYYLLHLASHFKPHLAPTKLQRHAAACHSGKDPTLVRPIMFSISPGKSRRQRPDRSTGSQESVETLAMAGWQLTRPAQLEMDKYVVPAQKKCKMSVCLKPALKRGFRWNRQPVWKFWELECKPSKDITRVRTAVETGGHHPLVLARILKSFPPFQSQK